MKRILFIGVVIMVIFMANALVRSQPPAKLFDVRNGNGAVIGADTYTRATIIVYKDNAAKNKVEDQFALAYGYQATVPNPAFNSALPVDPVTNPQTIANPQSKAGFFNRQLTQYIKDVVKSSQVQAAAATAAASASATADTDLPL